MLALVILISVIPGCVSLPPPNSPVELIVEIPEHEMGPDTPPDQKTDQKAAPDRIKEVKPEPIPLNDKPKQDAPKDEEAIPEIKDKPKDTVKSDKEPKKTKTIEISHKIVRRTLNLPEATSKRKTTLTPDEIRQLLIHGATPGKRATFSDADMRRLANSDLRFGRGVEMSRDLLNFDQIKQILLGAWQQPGSVDINGLMTTVQISLRADGRLVSSSIVKASGNPLMDQSVMQAVRSVVRIPGVPAEFLSAHPNIEIVFESRK